jgi:hypothetical protein
MGCGSTKIDESTGRRVDDDDNMKGDSVLSQRNMAVDDKIISKLPGADDHVEFQVADPQAFNESLIQQRQQAIDNRSYRSTIESWQPKYLQQLTETIKAFSKGKSLIDRHWIIFYWITSYIAYDTKSYFSGEYGDQSAEGVFLTRKGVCAGYANLYKYLCDQLQLPCEIVDGYSKGYGFEFRKNPPLRTDHAWNAVEIDHHWYLIESTWGAGHLNGQNVFEHDLHSYYFLPNPSEMIYHHLPEDKKWQLLRTPIELTAFMQMPHLRPLYFELEIELISPRNQVHISLLPGKSYALVFLRAPSDVSLIGSLKFKDEDVDGGHYIMFDELRQLYRCYFAPANIGKHKITIFAKKGASDKGEHHVVLEFMFDVKRIPKNIVSFPRTWKNFFDYGLEVISPQNTHLIKLNNASHTQIRIKAPENIELVGRLRNENGREVKGGDRIYYDQEKNIWQCQFAPDRDGLFEALILAKKKSEPGSYRSAVSFKIDAEQVSAGPISYPHTWPVFHDLGLKIEAPKNSSNAIWPDNASYAEVLIQAPKDVQLSGHIEFNNMMIKDGSLAQFDHERKLWQLLFAPEQTGPHELIVFARRINDEDSSAAAAVKFNLDVTKLRRPMKFPLIYTQFQTKKCQLYTPLDGILKKDSILPIHCMVPDAIDVNVIVDSQSLKSTGYSNSVLHRQIKVGSNNVVICAKYDQTSDYDALVQYTVQ